MASSLETGFSISNPQEILTSVPMEPPSRLFVEISIMHFRTSASNRPPNFQVMDDSILTPHHISKAQFNAALISQFGFWIITEFSRSWMTRYCHSAFSQRHSRSLASKWPPNFPGIEELDLWPRAVANTILNFQQITKFFKAWRASYCHPNIFQRCGLIS